ncbi:MAG: riboflavin synthase [Acidobacteriota bacterium]|nr:riboflavin synthase [Acidobacteriota bacterium]
MFSGIVETTSPILKIEDTSARRRVWIRKPRGWKLATGESVCVDGVCSTVESRNTSAFEVIYMPETLRRTTLARATEGCSVNLERSLALNGLVGGHLVQGHVDSIARIRRIEADGAASIYEFALPKRWMRYVVEKGSVAIDGVSLTVIDPRAGGFSVSLLQRTRTHTTLGGKGENALVNIEVDVVAKYMEKLMAR